jgi:feruloyl esterase
MDGLVDDLIDDPRDCRFDPVALQCPTGTDQPSCLTPAQIDAARMLYAGPTDAHGRRLYPGGQTRGSELSWDSYHWLILPAGERRLGRETACRHLPEIRQISPRYAHSSVADFEFTEAYSQPD